MNIWFVNQYACEPRLGPPGRHYFLSKELVKLGHNIKIFSASYNHIRLYEKKIKGIWSQDKVGDVGYIWIRVFHYKSSKSVIRFLNWLFFSFFMFIASFFIKGRPDVIVYSSPSPFGYMGCFLLSRIFNCKLVFEVRDVWPNSLIELGGISERNCIMKLMSLIEKFACKKSDRVWSNLKNFDLHMREIGVVDRGFSWFPNGVDLNFFNRSGEKVCLDSGYRTISKLKEKNKILGYIGTVGNANALNNLLSAAKILKDCKDLVFVIVGDGGDKESLKNYAKTNCLKNVYFFDSVSFENVSLYVSLFDFCYLGTKPLNIYKYGIASLKIPEYMVCRKPVIHAAFNSVVEDANCGFRVLPDSPNALSIAIGQLLSMSDEELTLMGLNGETYAKRFFDYTEISKAIDKELRSYV